MQIKSFAIEQFFARYEFSSPYILCASDCETITIETLLKMAGLSLAELGTLSLGYTESQGHPELRQAISRGYQSAAADDIVLLATPEEGIYLIMRTLLEPGDHVVVLTPAYDSLLNLAEHVSGNVSQWQIQPENAGWQLDLSQLDEMVTTDTKLVVLNFPHNPTGYLPSQAQFQQILAIAQKHGAWVFCDEMYRGLEFDSKDQLPSAIDTTDQAIVLTGLSKVHGLPGLRSGWLVIRDRKVREELINWKHYTSICAPGPSEFLAMAAIRAQDQLASRSREIIKQNLITASGFFDRWSQLFKWRPPQAGSVALVGLNQPSATEYCHALAKETGILLLPSSCMGYGDKDVRIGLGRADFAQNLAHYEQHLLG